MSAALEGEYTAIVPRENKAVLADEMFGEEDLKPVLWVRIRSSRALGAFSFEIK